MENDMKKIISLGLVLMLCFSLVTTAFAEENFTQLDKNNVESLTIYQVSDGYWELESSGSVLRKTDAMTIVPEKDYEGVYTNFDGAYFQEVEENIFILVDQVTLELNDYNSYLTLDNYNLPTEVMDGIASMAAFAKENNCTEAEVSLFVPATNARLNTLPRTQTSWNGFTFYNYQVYFTNFWTQWQPIVEKSATTQAALTAIKNISIDVAGAVSAPIGIATALYSNGLSCLEAWKAATGRIPIYGRTENAVMVDVCYDIYLKYTYYYDPIIKKERLGCSSQRAIIRQIETDTYLYSNHSGDKIRASVRPNRIYNTPNYLYPEETAYKHHLGIWTERVTGKVYSTTIEFAFPNFSWPSDWP